ncbi:MAG: hypothetical protein AAFY69_15610, partial [Pseudomonadota bacterium]
QNTVLVYLSMGRPSVCSAQAAAGLAARDMAPIAIVDGEAETAAACLHVLAGDHASGDERRYVLEHYDWGRNLSRLGGIVAGESSAPKVAAGG